MGHLGTAWMLDKIAAVKLADAVIVGDAGSPLVKGLMWLEVCAVGKPPMERFIPRITGIVKLDFVSTSTMNT